MHNRIPSAAKVRRSRAGCSNCRRQRIKCDEQYPTCQQCAKRRRLCNLSESRFRNYEPQFDARLELARIANDDSINYIASPSHLRGMSIDVNSDTTEAQARPPDAIISRHDIAPHPLGAGIDTEPNSPDGRSNERLPGSTAGSSSMLADEQPLVGVLESRSTFRRIPADSRFAAHRSAVPVDSQVKFAGRCSSRATDTPAWRQLPQNDHDFAVAGAAAAGQITPSSAPSASTQHDVTLRHNTSLETSEERAYLLRHFSSTPARWMDLFDLECFYSRQAPILALRSPLIMNSACALAAKQLGAVSGGHSSGTPQQRPSSPGRARFHSGYDWCEDYGWSAAAYYDAAISLLLQHISDLAARDGRSVPHSTRGVDSPADRFSEQLSPEVSGKEPLRPKAHHEIVVAATILAVYEFLGGDAPTWSDHLDGTRSFLRLSDEAGFLDFHASPPLGNVASGPSGLLRAAFWNFARQDMLSALIHGKKTRLEIDDFAMWRRMGLSLSTDGCFVAGDQSFHPEHDNDRIDLISNTLVWMLGRIVNFIVVCNDDVSDANSNFSQSASTSHISSWLRLKNELRLWFDALPPPFQPCSQVRLPQTTSRSDCIDCQVRSRSLIDHETWHSDSMCASTMQSYHMAEIFLLLHKPRTLPVEPLPLASRMAFPVQDKIPDALSDFQQMNAVLQYHAVEICAIALSHPEEAARIHMLQPLYLAGRCLTDVSDRRIVVSLIDSIEDELGWHAKYRVDSLLAEWAISREALNCGH